MPETSVASFEIKHLSVLDENGKADASLMPELSDAQIKQMYETMVLTRAFDKTALDLQREGRMGTYASVEGQEAQVGVAFAAGKEDWVFPCFREQGVEISLGKPLWREFLYWMGDERGQITPDNVRLFTNSIPVGTQTLHAVGAAWANKILKKPGATIVFFGDGGTSTGNFYESMNFAGVFKIPTLFINQNNQWAISVPRSKQSAAQTLAQKAVAAGIPGLQVDGNDVFAVYKATKDALEAIGKGEGPRLIEMVTYRMGDHTTADDAKRYRPAEEVEAWRQKDPIIRLKKYMLAKGSWTEQEEQTLQARVK